MAAVVATLAVVAAVGVLLVAAAYAQNGPAVWRQPQQPVRIFGNAWYVGTRGLGAILVTSPTGAVLIDGAVRESASDIANNITSLGIRLADVKLIVNSHAHNDHAGGIAELQRRTGATVAALPWSAEVLRSGQKDRSDPQFETPTAPAERVANVRTIQDGEVLRAGDVAITAHKTAGHTPGGTTWTWRSCQDDRCVDIVYADSVTAVSADAFRFSDSRTYPQAVGDFTNAIAFLRMVSCDILVTPHPEASDFWGRVERRDAGERDALIDRSQCVRYADRAEAQLKKRLETEATCTLIVDAISGETLVGTGTHCDERLTPASSFKVPLALAGFDSGILQDQNRPAWPYRQEYAAWDPLWKRTTTPATWMQDSVVWYSQELTRRLGAKRFKEYVDRLDYGNRDVRGASGRDGLTTAWLSSSLRISATEQVAFVRRLVRRELPVSRSATARTMAIMPSKVVDGWRVSGKTGTGARRLGDGTNDRDRQVGWFVGWATRDGRTLVFARLIVDEQSERVRAGWRARDTLFADWPALMARATSGPR